MKQNMTQSSLPGCWETRTGGRGQVFCKIGCTGGHGTVLPEAIDLKTQGCKKRVGERSSVSVPVK